MYTIKSNVLLLLVITLLFNFVSTKGYCEENDLAWIERFQEGDTTVTVEEPYEVREGVLYLGTTLVAYPQTKKEASFTVPEGTQTIGDFAFFSNEYLTHVVLPDSVGKIGECAFDACTYLKRVELPKHLLVIDCSAFSRCRSLDSIQLNDELYAIGEQAFLETPLRSIEIPSSVRFIGSEVFAYAPIQEVRFLPYRIDYIGIEFIDRPYASKPIEFIVPSPEYAYVEHLMEEYEDDENVTFTFYDE